MVRPARAADRWMAVCAVLSEMVVVVVVAGEFPAVPAAAPAGDGRNGGPAGSLALLDGTEAHMGHNIAHVAHSSRPTHAGGPFAGNEHPGETADAPAADAAEQTEDGMEDPVTPEPLEAWVDAVVEAAPAVPAAAAVEEEQAAATVA